MAGHSQFKNIMHRKGAQDAKRAKVFTKIIRELTVASQQGGEDPETNPRLRTAITTARAANMPKDTMERAIKKGSGPQAGESYHELCYEGYGPGGVAIIVEALSDNKNRTAAEVRSTFTKYGGRLGETNSVRFSFDHLGVVGYPKDIGEEALFEVALEAGAEDVRAGEDSVEIVCARENLHHVQACLAKVFGDPVACGMAWVAHNSVSVDGKARESLAKLIKVLEDNDDVQSVWCNVGE